MARDNSRADFFNVDYGLASVAVTTGSIAITTTEAAYHGLSIVAGDTVLASITIYDSNGAAGGNIIERVNVDSLDSIQIERQIPVMAKKGLYIVAAGADLTGTVFYGPKG